MLTSKNKLALGYVLATIIIHDEPSLQETDQVQDLVDELISDFEQQIAAHNSSVSPNDKMAEVTIESRDHVISTTVKLEYIQKAAPRFPLFSRGTKPTESKNSQDVRATLNDIAGIKKFYNIFNR